MAFFLQHFIVRLLIVLCVSSFHTVSAQDLKIELNCEALVRVENVSEATNKWVWEKFVFLIESTPHGHRYQMVGDTAIDFRIEDERLAAAKKSKLHQRINIETHDWRFERFKDDALTTRQFSLRFNAQTGYFTFESRGPSRVHADGRCVLPLDGLNL